jgi:hypothetical protein
LKNKIQKFSKGDFQLIRPDVIFDETNLVLIIGEGEVYRGSFTMRANNEGRIRGLVYSSSFRVHFKDQGFEGNPARVEFTYDGRGLRPGHVEEGKFTVVCTGGEFELAFTAIIEKPYVMTTYGKVQSTDDFRKLAIKDFSEAGRLFRSKEFYEILKYENERTFYLYDNMQMVSRRTGHGRIHGRDQTERMHFPYASGRGDAIRRSDRVDKGNTDSDEKYMGIYADPY